MRRYSSVFAALVGGALAANIGSISGCGGSKGGSGFGSSNGGSGGSGSGAGTSTSSSSGGGSGGSSGGGGSSGSFGDGGFPSSSSGGTTGDGGTVCPPGLMCNISCPSGTTTITGKVYDPAGKNPLYNVAVYVPAMPLQPLPKGVPTGSDACSCAALFKSGAVVTTTTDETGSFTLSNAPAGNNVPLVLQVGKWRRSLQINVTACQANAQPDKSLTLPGTVAAGSDDNMPDIAVSTGSADTLECLMKRIGLPDSEYVAGSATGGHVHVYSGGTTGTGGGGGVGRSEGSPMPGAPAADTDLWADQAHLMPYDITLLSCEGGETYDANPQALEAYLNAGGRAFASHFHYAWFSGPINTVGMNTYMAPADWGNNLATWQGDMGGGGTGPIGGIIQTTLNGSTAAFPKGVSLQKWLTNVNALGQNGVPAGELSIYDPRYNAVVSQTNKPSQAWITADQASGMGGQTMYFSFDTPVNAPPAPDGGAPQYCGRAVFSDLHVGSNSGDLPNGGGRRGGGGTPPPAGCQNQDLSPQEKALEFMLFDLSSCVIPDNIPPMVPNPPQ